jgi:hypothetical protein
MPVGLRASYALAFGPRSFGAANRSCFTLERECGGAETFLDE